MKVNSKAIKFYAILVIGLAVLGIFASTAASKKAQRIADSAKSTTVPTTRQVQEIEITTEVNRNIKGVADERYTTPEAEAEATAQPPIQRNESYVMPLSSEKIKDYSNGEPVYSKTMEDWRAHTGVDFAGNEGDSVLAVNNGIVTRAYDDALWGTILEIDHGDGIVSRYCGRKFEDALAEGTKVNAGEKVGTLGILPIESADGIHLHFEIIINGETANPFDYLPEQ